MFDLVRNKLSVSSGFGNCHRLQRPLLRFTPKIERSSKQNTDHPAVHQPCYVNWICCGEGGIHGLKVFSMLRSMLHFLASMKGEGSIEGGSTF